MVVNMKRKEQEIDCWVGDIVLFNSIPCMVIGYENSLIKKGLLALEGSSAGRVIEEFEGLNMIDKDERVTKMLIKQIDVVISNGE